MLIELKSYPKVIDVFRAELVGCNDDQLELSWTYEMSDLVMAIRNAIMPKREGEPSEPSIHRIVNDFLDELRYYSTAQEDNEIRSALIEYLNKM